MENFREAARQGEALGVLQRAEDSGALARLFRDAVSRPDETARRGAEAARFVAASRGAAASTAEALAALAPALGAERGSAP
jgi:hypothetical protein